MSAVDPLSELSLPRRVDLARLDSIRRRKYPVDATSKRCNVCRVVKPLDAFSPFKRGALGRQARCKPCINARGVQYTKRIRELRADRPRPERCEVCNQRPHKGSLHWDHDHSTGKFRGWLCSPCNNALGNVKDNPERLAKLIRYLVRHKLSHGEYQPQTLSERDS